MAFCPLVPTLNPLRKSCVFLCVAALLLGNAAGWVHVGCVHSPTACCSHSDSGNTASVAPPVACCSHSHAHHHEHSHDSPSASTTSCSGEKTAPSRETQKGSSDPSEFPAEHDHERCSVCQSFFASRDGMLTCIDVPAHFAVASEFSTATSEPTRSADLLRTSISVRGPPQIRMI